MRFGSASRRNWTVRHIDRNVMAVIFEPVRREFGLSDGAIGVLTGVAHSTALALFILPMGWLVDRTNRVRLIGTMVVVWSGLTALGATAQGYIGLLAIRAGVGAAEAAGSPASVSILADSFSARERPNRDGNLLCPCRPWDRIDLSGGRLRRPALRVACGLSAGGVAWRGARRFVAASGARTSAREPPCRPATYC